MPDDIKTPDEVRAELQAARAAYQTRNALHLHFGWTSSPSSFQDWNLQRASPNDAAWNELLDEYVATYERYFYPALKERQAVRSAGSD